MPLRKPEKQNKKEWRGKTNVYKQKFVKTGLLTFAKGRINQISIRFHILASFSPDKILLFA